MRICRNYDVGSYYPHLMTINGYTSRNIPSPKIYEDVLDRRMEAKASGDKVTANALKLVCNTTYGCLLAGIMEELKRLGMNTFICNRKTHFYERIMSSSTTSIRKLGIVGKVL